MAEVGVLDLQIHDNSASAVGRLGNLASVLERVRDAVKGVSTKSAAEKIKAIGDAVNDAVKGDNVERFGALVKSLSELKDIGKISISMAGVKNAMKNLDKVKDAVKDNAAPEGFSDVPAKIEESNEALEEVKQQTREVQQEANKAGAAFESAAEKVTKFFNPANGNFDRIIGKDQTYEDLTRKVDEAQKWNDDVIATLASLRNNAEDPFENNINISTIGKILEIGQAARASGEDAEKFAERVMETRARAQELVDTLNRPVELNWANAIDQMMGIGQATKSAVDSMDAFIEHSSRMQTQIQELIDNLNRPITANWSEGIDQMMGIGSEVKSAADSMSAFMQGMQGDDAVAEGFRELNPELQQFCEDALNSGYNVRELTSKLVGLDGELKQKKRDVSEVCGAFDELREGIRNMLEPIRRLSNEFARIAKRMLIRAIIKQLVAGFKEGLQNLYFYSKAIGTDFAPAMDSAASSLLQMKNAIGAAVAPAIQALIPVLQTVVSWFITAVNYANQFMALISGKSGWTRALPVAADAFTETGRSARGAGRAARDAAKDVKELLADWDELNIIQSETGDNGGSGGGGGGAGAVATDYASMFEEVSGFNDEVRAFTENLRNQFGGVLGFVEKIGAAVLGWRVSQAFAGVIGALGGFVSTGAIIDLVFNIAQVFDKTYMQTGNAGWLVADVLTTLLGGTLAQRILRRVIGGGVANLVLPITFAVSAIASIKALVGQTDVSALSKESILTAITAALKGGAAAGLLLHAGGIPILQSIGAGVAGSLITFGAAIGIKAIKTVVDTGVITKETILADVTSALATGLGVAGLELALGGTIAAAATLGAGALIFTAAALIGIQAILSKPKRVTWGDYSATQEEIQAYVENTLFTVKPNTQIALLNPKIEAVSTSESGLIATADEIKLAAKKVVIGFNDKETLADLEKQIFGDSENGTTGLIGQFNETIRNKHAVIETGIMLTLGSTKEGGQEAKSLIASDSKEWKVLEGHMADLGKQLSASLKKAYDESLDDDTRQMAISSIEQLTSMMEEVSYAISQGEAAARAEINLSKNLGNLSKDSISGIVDYIAQYREEMTSATAEAWDAVTVQKGGLVAGLRQSMDNALELSGGDTNDATYKAYKAAYDKATDEYNAWVAGRDDAIKDAADKAKNSKAWEKLRESILGMIDGKAGVESLTDGVYESLSSMLSGGDATKDEVLGYMIDAYFGKDAETIRALVREGVLEYKDVISEEAIEALGSTAGIYGSPEMIDAWNSFVTELFGGGIGTIEPEPLDVEQELEVQTEVKEATGGGNGDETVLGTLKETTEKHLAETDVVISTHTFPATSSVDTSATTSATEQMKNDIRNDVLEAIAYLDLINRYTGHIADGRTHLTETSRFVRTRATGGTIRSGEMFFANENGNIEMMGKMGNSAVVANNQQIVDGISKGVAASNKGMENSMDMMVSLMRQLLNKELTARVVPSSSMGRNNAMSNEAYRRVTG